MNKKSNRGVKALENLLDSNTVIRNTRIAYGIHGKGEPLVLIHGTPSHSYEWRKVLPKLTSAGYQVYIYDLLGYGKSERPLGVDTSVTAQAELLSALLDEWNLDRAHIVGHDIGGAIAMRLAVFHPQRVTTLTVIDSVSYDSWPSETWQKIIKENLDSYSAMSESEFKEMLHRQLRMTVHDQNNMKGDILENYLAPHKDPLGRVSFFYHQVKYYDSKHTEEIAPFLKDLSMPVQILWGEEDSWQPVRYAQRLHQDIPNSELHIIANAGHFVMEDNPALLSEYILSFVKNKL